MHTKKNRRIIYNRTSYNPPKTKRAIKVGTFLNKFNEIIKQSVIFKEHTLSLSISPNYKSSKRTMGLYKFYNH